MGPTSHAIAFDDVKKVLAQAAELRNDAVDCVVMEPHHHKALERYFAVSDRLFSPYATPLYVERD